MTARSPVADGTWTEKGCQRWLLQELSCQHNALDLVGPLVYLSELRIPHHPLDRVVLDIPVPAEQLNRVRGYLHRRIGREAFARRGEEGEIGDLRALHGTVRSRRRRVGELPGRFELHPHVGQHELHALEIGDLAAELLALLHI